MLTIYPHSAGQVLTSGMFDIDQSCGSTGSYLGNFCDNTARLKPGNRHEAQPRAVSFLMQRSGASPSRPEALVIPRCMRSRKVTPSALGARQPRRDRDLRTSIQCPSPRQSAQWLAPPSLPGTLRPGGKRWSCCDQSPAPLRWASFGATRWQLPESEDLVKVNTAKEPNQALDIVDGRPLNAVDLRTKQSGMD